MNQVKVDDRLKEVFRAVFEDEELQVAGSTTAADVEGWDSVAHINLIFAIEEEFGIQFSSRELEEIRNVGDLQAIISQRAP